uniref:Apple domain-containing protein n=1 Tax=Oryza meridionalis TaxID=40149 RepID=A0A0E0EA66_9ORYZ
MTSFGNFQLLGWDKSSLEWITFSSFPTHQCTTYGYCGPNGYCDITTGAAAAAATCKCLLLPPATPREPAGGDGFLALPRMKVPDKFSTLAGNMTFDECAARCAMNCSCEAYAHADLSSSSARGDFTSICSPEAGDRASAAAAAVASRGQSGGGGGGGSCGGGAAGDEGDADNAGIGGCMRTEDAGHAECEHGGEEDANGGGGGEEVSAAAKEASTASQGVRGRTARGGGWWAAVRDEEADDAVELIGGRGDDAVPLHSAPLSLCPELTAVPTTLFPSTPPSLSLP